MAITGTGTGPFTITGTETTISIYNFVVAANAANATKNAASTQFTFLCVLNVGNGATTTLWNPTEQEIEISASSFAITVNATVQCGTPNGPRAGCYFKVTTPSDTWVINGTLNAYASRMYSQTRVQARTGSVIYLEDCNNAFLDSIDNGLGTLTPTISYIRGTHAGATSVAVKLGGNMVLESPRIYNATWALQPLTIASGAATYTIRNYVGVNNTNDVIPNTGTTTTNVIGAFDSTGVPRSNLIVSNPTATAVVRLQWTYDLTATAAGVALPNAIVRIQRSYGVPTTVFSGTTNASGKITQQNLSRFEFFGSTFGSQMYPYLTSVRIYNKDSQQLVYNADNHAAQVTAHATIATPSLSQAAAAALTGITLTAAPTTAFFKTITNGTFDTDTAWTKGAGVTISGGVANCNNSGYILGQVNDLTVGTVYTFTMNYVKTAGIALRVSSGTVDGANIIFTSGTLANGSGTITFTFTAARPGLVIGASGAVFSGTIDNVSCGLSYNTVLPNDGVLAISTSKSVADVWSYWRNFISTLANFDSADTWEYDGSILNAGAWTTSITGGTVSAGTLVSPTISVASPAIVSANLTGAITNSGTVSGVVVGNVVNTGTIDGASITGNVTQATPTNLTGVTIIGNYTFNTNTPVTVTFTNSSVSGTVSNSGTGLVTVQLATSTVGTVGTNVTTQIVTALNLTGLLADSQIYLSDGTNTQVDYVSSSGTSYTYNSTGGTGTWTWRLRKYGYQDQTGTFTPATNSATVAALYLVDSFVSDTLVNVTAYTDLETTQKIYDYSRYFATTNTGIALGPQFTKGFGTLTANSAFTLDPLAVAMMAVSSGVTTHTTGLNETATVVVTGNFTQGTATLSNNIKIRATNLDSELLFSGIDSLTIYATQADALTNTSPGASSSTGIIRFLYGASLSGVTMSGTVYLRIVLGTAIQVQSLTLVLGENEVNLSTTTLLQAIPSEVLNATVEANVSLAESLRLANSVLGGKVSGAGTATETFRDINDTKNRVVADVDNNGNRTAITLDLS